MLRLVLLFFTIGLFSCGSEQADNSSAPETPEEQKQTIQEEVVIELAPHANFSVQQTSLKTVNDCTLTEPLYLADRIEDLNALSQQMFALDDIEGVNGYANFITLAQLALTSNTHTSKLIEQLGLPGITESEQWFNVFCYLENVTPTNTLSISMAEYWLIRNDFYASLVQKFQASFSSRTIDAENDLWRLSLDNDWAVELQLTIDDEIAKYVNFQNTADAENTIAHALVVTDNINSASNEFGDYFSITNNSDYTVHIIMPTFTQYPHVKSNIVDVLNGFKALEKTPQNELYIPYFSQVKSSDNFISFLAWLNENSAQSLLDNEEQDYSGINQYETVKLINSDNNNGFEFNAEGRISPRYQNTITAEALFYVEQSFSHSVNFQISHDGNMTLTCNEKVEADSTWRPYFMIIENTKNSLVYSIVTNAEPEIKSQEGLCAPITIVDD